MHRSRRFINQYFRLTDQNAKLFTRNHDMCFAEKSARMRPGCSRWSAAWSKHWRQCVWLTCQTRTHDTLASRCSKRAARKPPRCGTGDRAKNTHTVNCHRSGQHYLKSGGPTYIWVARTGQWQIKCTGPNWSGGLKSAPGQRASAYVEGCLTSLHGKPVLIVPPINDTIHNDWWQISHAHHVFQAV